MTAKTKTKSPSGNSRAAQNRKIRRDALREQLKGMEYIRQLHFIAQKLNPRAKNAYKPGEVPMAKARADILKDLLNRCLPSLRPVDLPINFKISKIENADSASKALSEILQAASDGKLSTSQARELSSVVEGYIKSLEVVDFEARLKKLELRSGA